MANTNPLIFPRALPFEAIPFRDIKAEQFTPALDEAISRARTDIQKVKNEKTEPTFQNTIIALETAGETLTYVAEVFFNLHSTMADEDIQKLAGPISEQLAAYSSEVSLDADIFKRVKAVYEKRGALTLSTEEKELLNRSFKSFARNGALLNAADKEKLRLIDQELAKLGPEFSEHLLKASMDYRLPLYHPDDLKGLPASAIEALEQKCLERYPAGSEKVPLKDGERPKWLVSLDEPIMSPFLKYSERRDLRETVWRAWNTRSFGGPYDNSKIVVRLAQLRHDRAVVLGYASHADYVLEERMAQTPTQVVGFLDRMLKVSAPAAQKELAELEEFAKKLQGPAKLMPWDFGFYQEKLRLEKFKIDPEKLREYFEFSRVLKGAFDLASRLYNLKFTERADVDIYHPEVRVFEVQDALTGNLIGLLYTDFFPRATKRAGAWCSSFREQGLFAGLVRRPHVSIVGNFSKPSSTSPALLTWNEVQTLFHEFGHALHALLSDCTFRSLAGTNVYWDFVELPSQFMENWILEKEVLDLIAHHYKTGASLPADWIQKLKDESQFFAGFASCRQISFALLDMAWHTERPSDSVSVESFEKHVMKPAVVMPQIDGTCFSTSFGHIFAGGYSAGYYSYKWAEVLEADAYEFFTEQGIFNSDVAKKFRDSILSRGGTEHPMTLYKKFRGREPDPTALLRREGLIEPGK